MMTEEEWSDYRKTHICRIEEGDLVQLSSYGLHLWLNHPNLTIFAGEMGVVVEGNISRHSNSFATVAVQWIKPNRNKTDHVSFRKLKLIRKKKQPIRINKSEMVRRRKREERKAHWRGVYLARRKRIWRRWVGGILFILLSLLVLSSF